METREVHGVESARRSPPTADVAPGSTRRAEPRRTRLRMRGALAVLILGIAAPQARAEVQYVANTGSDSGACGAAEAPCRTISRAIERAAPGDRIVVLPGVYGDVDGDGEFISPGDEPARYDTGCRCLIDVDKPLTIVSRRGAGATVLRGAVDGLFAVRVSAPGVVLGRKKKGFSVVGDAQHDGYGVFVTSEATGASIEGNSFSRLEAALFVAGSGSLVRGNRISQTWGRGIHVEGESVRVIGNVVEQTGTLGDRDAGIYATGAGPGGHTIRRNVVVGNMGLAIYLDGFAAQAGMQPHVVAENLVVGNALAGIKVVLGSGGGNAHVTGNTIYGNDPQSNCGLMTLSAGPAPVATGNYWGGPGGPGGDPKDAVCSLGTPPDLSAPAARDSLVVPRIVL